jgi:hypothetical protein
MLAPEEAEISKITVQSQPGQIVCKTLSQKYTPQKQSWWMVQGVGPEFKPQHHKKKKKRRMKLCCL